MATYQHYVPSTPQAHLRSISILEGSGEQVTGGFTPSTTAYVGNSQTMRIPGTRSSMEVEGLCTNQQYPVPLSTIVQIINRYSNMALTVEIIRINEPMENDNDPFVLVEAAIYAAIPYYLGVIATAPYVPSLIDAMNAGVYEFMFPTLAALRVLLGEYELIEIYVMGDFVNICGQDHVSNEDVYVPGPNDVDHDHITEIVLPAPSQIIRHH